VFTETDIFISGQDDINIYRIPALVVAKSGNMLAFIEARDGGDGDPTDLTLKRSIYTGVQEPAMLAGYPRLLGYGFKWERMRLIYPGNGEAVMNPCPVLDETTGRIWLPFCEVYGGLREHIKDSFAGRFLLTWSDDEGITWAPPRDLTGSIPRFVCGPGVSVQMRNGRIVIPGYGSPSADAQTHSYVVYSDDGGQTWRRGADVRAYTDEPQAVELSDGVLMFNCRSNEGKGCRYVALSRDGGQTWFDEYHEPALPDPVCQGSIIRQSDASVTGEKPLLVFVNCNSRERVNLTVRISADDGRTWSVRRTIHPGHAAYSSVAFLPDGTLGVLYETGKDHPYEKITFSRFDLDWAAGG
jgi:sialidase-1